MKRTALLIITMVMATLTASPLSAAPIAINGIDTNALYSFDGTSFTPLNDNDLDSAFAYRSAAFWFNTTDADLSQMIYEEGGRTNGLNVFIDDGLITAGAWAGADGSWLSTSTTANTWHHVAYIYQQDQFSLYYDGVFIDSITLPFTTIPNHSGANGLGGINGWSMIADGNAGQVNADYYFSGMITGIVFDDQAQDLSWVETQRSQTTPVPLPASFFLLAAGIVTVVGFQRRPTRKGSY